MEERKGFFNAQWLIGLLIVLALGVAVVSILLSDNFGKKGDGLGREFEYDISALQKTNPELILYREITPAIDTGLPRTLKIVVDSADNIYISSENTIASFNAAGQKRSYTAAASNNITALEMASDGSIYAGVGNQIEIFDEQGKQIDQWALDEDKAIVSAIGVTKDFVFLADRGNRTIQQYDHAGNKLSSFGDFVIPSPFFDLEIAPDDTIKVVNPGNHRVETYTANGNMQAWWGEFNCIAPEGFCGCCNPVNIALLPDSAGFIACEKGLTRVKIYDMGGKFLGFVAGTEQFKDHDTALAKPSHSLAYSGLDAAVDSTGRVLVLDPATAEIRIFKKKTKTNDKEQ
ncbi:hypothetical protein GF373_14725 [bacterium]|nr:hypothetical protein [bacterium]